VRRLAVIALGAWLLAGCGGSDSPESTTSVETSTVTTTTTAAGEPDVAEDPPATTASPIEPTGKLTFFLSPSGNIGCAAAPVSVRCDIIERDWEPPEPAGEPCSLDYGNGIAVGKAGPATFTCAGDTVFDPSAAVLEYGEHVELYGYRCESREQAMVCENPTTGNGFELSRERGRTF
jgi:hypothetical protein